MAASYMGPATHYESWSRPGKRRRRRGGGEEEEEEGGGGEEGKENEEEVRFPSSPCLFTTLSHTLLALVRQGQ